jgi:hypothetical protein
MVRMLRMKAEEVREIAMGMKDFNSRRLMLNAAANYDRFADEAAKGVVPKSLTEWMKAS